MGDNFTLEHLEQMVATEGCIPVGQAKTGYQSTEGTMAIDAFDPQNYKKPQDPRLNPASVLAASGLPTTIEARRPKKTWFIRIHPDSNYQAILPLFTDDDATRRENNSYLFAPGLDIPEDMEDLVRDTLVVPAITSAAIHFLYVLPIADNTWYETGVQVIRLAREGWVRVTPDQGGYTAKPPIAKLDEPQFPNVPLREYLERAFAKRLITSLEHPLVKKLRGAR